MTFKYRVQQRGNEVRYLPLIPVDLYHGKRHIRVRALIDSGAEHTVFGQELAEFLGIDLTHGRQVTLQSIAGTIPGYLMRIELELGSHRWATEVIFSDGISADSGLLGQLGFFQFFSVTFLYSQTNIIVRRARWQGT